MKTLVSLPIDLDEGDRDPALQAFLERTYAWLDELRADVRRCTGSDFAGNGVLFAHDVLIELHGRDASWARFDVHAFERWIAGNAPGFLVALPQMLADVMCFTNYLARHGHLEPAIAIETERRTFEVLGLDPLPPARPSRRERRRAARAKRRLH